VTRVLGLVALAFVFALPSAAEPPIVGPPTSFALHQNDPSVFCSGQGTRIEFQLPQTARIELVVQSADGSQVLRTLAEADMNTGLYAVAWDGRDATGAPLTDGTYPYRLRAFDAQSTLLFEDTRKAIVDCQNLPVTRNRWGPAKARYR
jgi:hypothetical protein